MRFKYRQIVLDAADLATESAFWAGLLDGTVKGDDRWHNVWIDGGWALAIQHAPDHVPPVWPDGAPPQQIHLDFYTADLESAHQKVLELGGRVLRARDNAEAHKGVRIYADPAGHPFCLCWLPPADLEQ
ncbi:VOC family protein [Actinopolymorpha sp. NPDC004070]|uniref:VOC family protein n=1 Tax=Actinopolymorpha sp. NPDC004070 TaxID=3154548 RepID=UPI0033BC493C